LAGCLVAWLFGWLFGCLVAWLFGWLFGLVLTYSRLPMRGFTYLKVAKFVNFLFNILFLEQITSHLLLYIFNFLFTYLKLSSSIDYDYYNDDDSNDF
jgi:hypothetical protein